MKINIERQIVSKSRNEVETVRNVLLKTNRFEHSGNTLFWNYFGDSGTYGVFSHLLLKSVKLKFVVQQYIL